MRIAVLGPLEVRTGTGEPVELTGTRLRTLLVRLALDAGRVVTNGQLIDALWADNPPAGAVNALQALVSRLRRALPSIAVESHPAGYRLALPADEVDALRFEQLVSRSLTEGNGQPQRRAALALWRGEPLVDFPDADFARSAAIRLTELRLSTLESAAGAGVDASLVADLESMNRTYPTRETLAAALIRGLAETGRPADALLAFERTRAALAEELGTDPSTELAQAHLDVLRGVAPTEAVRSNVPASRTSFVARDDEVGQVRRLLATNRLVTLVGPGGAGKTRLALEIARGERDPDGVWLVELAAVSDPTEIAGAVLGALGVREQAVLPSTRLGGSSRPAPRLLDALRDRRLLIVLDNCEHLIGAAAAMVDEVLGACADVRILATSREPLGLIGEALWTVEPLAVPPIGVDLADIGDYAAVALFGDRAAAARPGFAIDATNGEDLTVVCRALDGLPLAIELAAARLRSMTLAQVNARLDDRFRLLVGGSRTALPRHQTLRAVVEWSWDLLSDDERALLRRLAVFSGGCDLAAAQAIGGLGRATSDLLYALADKSLVVIRPAPEPRFDLLETIRAYGHERLVEAGEDDRVRQAHRAYFLTRAEAAEPHLRSHEQLTWLAELRADNDNLHAALRGAIAVGDATTSLRMVSALGWYWWLAGHRAEGADLGEAVMALPGVAGHPDRPQAQAVAALCVVDGNRKFTTIQAWIAKAAELAATTSDPTPALRIIGPLHALVSAGAAEQFAAFDELIHDPDLWVRATAHLLRSHALFNVGGDDAAGHDDLLAARALYAEIGERWGLASTESGLAEYASRTGDRAGALELITAALTHMQELGAREDIPQQRSKLARELWLHGRREESQREMHEAQREAELVGIGESEMIVLFERGDLARLSGDLDQARQAFDRAESLLPDRHVSPQLVALLRTAQGQLAAASGDLITARQLHESALEVALTGDGSLVLDAPVLGRVMIGFASLVLREGDPALAATWLGAAEAVTSGPDHSVPDRVVVYESARADVGDVRFIAAFTHGLGLGNPPAIRELAGLLP